MEIDMENEIENKTESTSEIVPANGVSSPPEKPIAAKPWIAAGFKSRDAWRVANGKKTGKSKKKAAVKASAKSAKKTGKKTGKKAVKQAAATKAKSKRKSKASKAKVQAKAGKKIGKKAGKKTGKKTGKKSLKAAGKTKDKKRKKPAPPKKGSVHDGSLKPVPLAKCSANVKKVLLAMKKGKVTKLADIVKKAFPSLSKDKASSRTRNQLRFIRTHGMAKLVGEGRYRRVA